MIDVRKEQDHYLEAFRRLEAEAAAWPAWQRRLRKAALARFHELGFPTARNEDWKFTKLAALTRIPFVLAPASDHAADRLPAPSWPKYRLRFVNGRLADQALPRDSETLVNVTNLLTAPSPVAEQYLARLASYQEHAFTALNTAFFQDGAALFIADGIVLEEPIYLEFVSVPTGEPTVAYPRNLLVVGRASRVRVVESYVGPANHTCFTNAVTEIAVGEGATVDHYKVQREGERAYHLANTQVVQAPASNFSSHYFGFGGALVRNEVRVRFDGPGSEATVNGLYRAAGTQHMDNHTVIDHAQPHCASHELYKGILDGQAHGVFNGKIFVRSGAQKTDAKQTNQTLLLSDEATINTKPQLEIYADDVKCTHGATVGNLDAEQLFYLRSRGLGLAEARALLIYAFANDLIGRVQIEPLRDHLEQELLARACGAPFSLPAAALPGRGEEGRHS